MEGRAIIKWVLAGLAIFIVLGYSFFILYDFVLGPRIVLFSPKSGFSTTTPLITISGRGIHISELAINSAETPFDLEGNFGTQLILADGYNIMKITAKDHYGRAVEKTIEIMLLGNKNTATGTEQMATTTEIIIN